MLKEKYQSMIGNSYGRWTVTDKWEKRPTGHIYFSCICDCGVERIVSSSSLLLGDTKSCGCARKESLKKLGDKRLAKSKKEFKDRIFSLVGFEYEFMGEYKGIQKKMRVIHRTCGREYQVQPHDFINGKRCPHCYNESRRMTNREFTKRVTKQVGTEYVFLEKYVTSLTKIKVKHEECGNTYEIEPNKFLKGVRCPKCIFSRGEKEVMTVLDDIGVKYEREKRFLGLGLKRYDFYLPGYNACIEYDGKQHYKSIEFWGGDENLELIKESDRIKNEFCKDNNIELLRIPYWEINNIKSIVTNFINESSKSEEDVHS